MSSFVDAITRAHDQYETRNLVWQRVLSLLMYIVGLATGILALPLLAIGPGRLIPLLPDDWEPTIAVVLDQLYYPVIFVVLLLALTTLYKVALPLKPPWYRGLPGALLAAIVFATGATGLRIYIDWLTGTGYTYGALAAPIAFLLATFFIGFAIVIGAHFNAAIQSIWPARLSDRRKRGKGPTVADRIAKSVREHPAAAVAALESLDYTVTRPAAAAPDAPAPPREE